LRVNYQHKKAAIIHDMQRTLHVLNLIFTNLVIILVMTLVLGRSDALPADGVERIRVFTRWKEFDFVQWMLDALALKNAQSALDAPRYLNITEQRETVYQYLDLVGKIDRLNYEIAVVYADPQEKNPEKATTEKRRQLQEYRALENRLGPLAESVVQAQLSYILEPVGGSRSRPCCITSPRCPTR
jgi:hypothetical protein